MLLIQGNQRSTHMLFLVQAMQAIIAPTVNPHTDRRRLGVLPPGTAGADPHAGTAHGQIARLLCHRDWRLPHLRHQGAPNQDAVIASIQIDHRTGCWRSGLGIREHFEAGASCWEAAHSMLLALYKSMASSVNRTQSVTCDEHTRTCIRQGPGSH